MKINVAIEKASQELKKKDFKSPGLDSEILLSKIIKKSREYIILNSNHNINDEEYNDFKKLISERSKGKPIAYLTGTKFFWKHEFLINEKVLIPRPDTEIIVEQVLNIYEKKNNINFLDIGVGSGCILLSILKQRKDFKATGIDVSSDALKYVISMLIS